MDLDLLPYVPARLQWPRAASTSPPCLGVVHDMEAPEGPLTAENCARFFAGSSATGSAHVAVDENSGVRCVRDDHMAAGARGFPYRGRTINDWALHLEHAGYARQSRAEWLDRSSLATLEEGAGVFARWCDLYTLPPYHLTDDQLAAGMHGIVGHGDISRVLHVSSGHTDPGTGFPWDLYLPMIRERMETEVWTPEEKARLLAGADASVEFNERWNKDARTKLEEVWTNLMDRDHPDPGFRKGNVGAMVQKLLYPPSDTPTPPTP